MITFDAAAELYMIVFPRFISARKQKVEPPSFLKKIGDIEVFRGMSAKFTACATGSPEPDVEWCVLSYLLLYICPFSFTII